MVLNTPLMCVIGYFKAVEFQAKLNQNNHVLREEGRVAEWNSASLSELEGSRLKSHRWARPGFEINLIKRHAVTWRWN